MTEEHKSPRIAALAEWVACGHTEAVDTFWTELAAEGTPLIEPIEGDERHVLVTFLWRGDEKTENVTLNSPWSEDSPDKNLMERLSRTNLFYRTYRARSDVRGSYQFKVNDPLRDWKEMSQEEMVAYFTSCTHDPLNPHALVWAAHGPYPEETTSVVTLPAAPPQPWSAPNPEIPSGSTQHHCFVSTILGNEREISVYLPPVPPQGLLVVFDSWSYSGPVPTATILDNLLAARRIPPLAAVLIDNPGKDPVEANATRSRELPCNQDFADFLAHEIVAWVREQYGIPADRDLTVTAGSSYGGLAATFAAFAHPEVFGRVLSQSGSYWWKPHVDDDNRQGEEDEEEWEWLTRQFVDRDRLPLRFYMDVGRLEDRGHPGAPTQLLSNRHMRNVLRAKGYSVHYTEYAGGHDYACWRGTLADGLLALFPDP